jgi:hypothetical protein
MIEGFNGYEINKDGVVRSMKMMNANPGHLLKLNKYGEYTLTNNRNERVRITPRELIHIVFESGLPLVPRPEDAIYLGSRNKKFYYDSYHKDEEGKEKLVTMDFSKYIVD